VSAAPLPEIDAVVLDCGDTLLELRPGREAICGEVLSGLGAAFEPERIRLAYRIADALLKQRSSEVDTPEKKAAFYTEFNTLLACVLGIESRAADFDRGLQAAFAAKRHWSAIEGAREALERLGERWPLHVLANWDLRLSEHLERNGMLALLTSALPSQELGAEKPDARAFEAFRARTGVDPARAVYVGNEYVADVVGSRRAGFTPLLLDREGFFGAATDCAVFRDWRGLADALLGS